MNDATNTDLRGHTVTCRATIPSSHFGHGIKPADIVSNVMDAMLYMRKCIETALEGRMVRVTSDHNGQPIGRSRKSWKGQVCKIKHVHIDLYDGFRPPGQSSISLTLEGHEYECSIPANEVEFV